MSECLDFSIGDTEYKPATRHGVIYEGRFYETGSIEFENLFLIEGRKQENKDTILGMMSDIYLQTEKETS